MLLIAHQTLRLLNMRYVVDIDGTICEHFNGPNFGSGQVYYYRIEKINKLYDEGHEIVYMTARGMGTKNNPEGNFDEESMNRARQKYGRLTETQLEEWGCKYTKLFLGKYSGDVYIDDKAIHSDDFFNNN